MPSLNTRVRLLKRQEASENFTKRVLTTSRATKLGSWPWTHQVAVQHKQSAAAGELVTSPSFGAGSRSHGVAFLFVCVCVFPLLLFLCWCKVVADVLVFFVVLFLFCAGARSLRIHLGVCLIFFGGTPPNYVASFWFPFNTTPANNRLGNSVLLMWRILPEGL